MFDRVQRIDAADVIRDFGEECRCLRAQGLEASRAESRVVALAAQSGHLKIALAGDGDEDASVTHAGQQRASDAAVRGDAVPPGVEVDGCFCGREADVPADDGPSPIAGDGQIGEYPSGAVRRGVVHADDPVAVPDDSRHLVLCQQREGGFASSGVGEEGEQIPLRDHRDVRMPHGEAGEVRQCRAFIV